MWFTITTSPDVAEKIKKQCEWGEKMNSNRSFILGKITHEKGLTSDYSVVQIKSRDGVKIEPSDIFFLGLFAAGQ